MSAICIIRSFSVFYKYKCNLMCLNDVFNAIYNTYAEGSPIRYIFFIFPLIMSFFHT